MTTLLHVLFAGALKVIVMDSIIKIPFKVSTSTSNFMSCQGVFSLIGFVIEKDKMYIYITLIVMIILCCSLFSSYFNL